MVANCTSLSSFIHHVAPKEKKRIGNGDRFRMGLEGAKTSPWNPYVSTAERNQVLFQSRSAQAGSNQQHDTCLTKCRLQ
jgi:hypothetical protein